MSLHSGRGMSVWRELVDELMDARMRLLITPTRWLFARYLLSRVSLSNCIDGANQSFACLFGVSSSWVFNHRDPLAHHPRLDIERLIACIVDTRARGQARCKSRLQRTTMRSSVISQSLTRRLHQALKLSDCSNV